MRIVRLLGIVLLAGSLAAACTCAQGADDGTGPDGDADADGDSDADTDADGDADVDAAVCGEQQFDISMEPVRVQILLDQSSSMGDDTPWGGGTSHWEEATAGLQHMLEDPRNVDFYFGLDAFPDGTLDYFEECYCADPFDTNCIMSHAFSCTRQCEVDLAPYVAMDRAAVTTDEILAYLSNEFLPGTFTNTPLLRQMRWYDNDRSADMPALYANDGSSYLVVISDGDDTCDVEEGDNPGPLIADLATTTAHLRDTYGIRSIAIGFGDTSGTMADELNAIAENGGTIFTEFFSITEAGALQEALDTISSTIVSCIYDIEEPDATADPAQVNFYFDEDVVGYDPDCADGWRWTADSSPQHPQVEFCGASCERLGTGDVSQIQARFGCATILW